MLTELMESLKQEIAQNFGIGPNPSPYHLVVNDGYDVCEKERGVAFFSNKTWKDVLIWLEDDKGYYLEELGCLDLEPLLKAYFDYAFEVLEAEDGDHDFMMFLFGELYQLKYMKKFQLFTPKNRELIYRFTELVKNQYEIKSNDSAFKDFEFLFEAIETFEKYS